MINPEFFVTYWQLLTGRFPLTNHSKEVSAMYYELLSDELDDEQFVIAIKSVFRNSQFFPSPKEIIEAAPSLNGLLRAEMIRLDIYCNLSEEWQFNGARTVAELPQDKQREYLAHLRTIKAAIAPAKL